MFPGDEWVIPVRGVVPSGERATLENFGKYSAPAAAAANNQDDVRLPPLAVVMDGWNHAGPLFFFNYHIQGAYKSNPPPPPRHDHRGGLSAGSGNMSDGGKKSSVAAQCDFSDSLTCQQLAGKRRGEGGSG